VKIAVVNEASAADKNPDIVEALQGYGHEIINVGMRSGSEEYNLNYLHTGFITALLIHAKRADLVVGGCGTAHGYSMSTMQFPGVYCSIVLQPLDTWLTAHINAPNCLSLALNKGYGWGSDINLKFMFDRFFSVEPGSGYPPHRKDAQREGKAQLVELSGQTHLPMPQIIRAMNPTVVRHTLDYPGLKEILSVDTIEDLELRQVLQEAYA
jgi:ribose 5-phosphate isomerase RpiB